MQIFTPVKSDLAAKCLCHNVYVAECQCFSTQLSELKQAQLDCEEIRTAAGWCDQQRVAIKQRPIYLAVARSRVLKAAKQVKLLLLSLAKYALVIQTFAPMVRVLRENSNHVSAASHTFSNRTGTLSNPRGRQQWWP